jgi:thiol-disulfide isomerase/thioredoxin
MMKKLLIVLAVLCCSVAYAQEKSTLVKISDQVPSFEFEKSPGISQNISESKGKVVLITFFATWCGPCRKELPSIQSEIYDKYKNNPAFELIILGREHSWDEVSKFKKENKYAMPFYPDPERKIYSRFATQFIPRTFLISKEGKIIFNTIGFEEKDFKLLKRNIEEQLKKS